MEHELGRPRYGSQKFLPPLLIPRNPGSSQQLHGPLYAIERAPGHRYKH